MTKELAKRQSDFLIVTALNAEKAARILRRGGHALIGKPGAMSYGGNVADLDMGWYDHPRLTNGENGWSLSTKRGEVRRNGETWQTGWERDRSYLWRRPSAPSRDRAWRRAQSLAQKAVTRSGHEMKIAFEYVAGQGIEFDKCTLLAVPKGADPKPAFAFMLARYAALMNGQLRGRKISDQEIAALVEYVAEDLRTGNVFGENVAAGMEADALTGLT